MKNIINIIMGIIISLIFMFAIIAVFGITWITSCGNVVVICRFVFGVTYTYKMLIGGTCLWLFCGIIISAWNDDFGG